MATYNLTSSKNWSEIKASLSSGDTIYPTGAYTLTLDEDPALTGIIFDATFNAVGAKVALGTPSSYALANWVVKAWTTVPGITVGTGKTVTGTLTVYGGNTAGGIGANITGTVTTLIAYAGTNGVASVYGATVGSGGVVTNATATGGTGTSCYGIIVQSGGKVTNGTGTGGSAASCHGIYLQSGATSDGTLTGYGGSTTNGAYGISAASGSTVTHIIGYGSNTSTSAYGASISGTVNGNVTGTGGSQGSSTGVVLNANCVDLTGYGGSAANSYGVNLGLGYVATGASVGVAGSNATGYGIYNTGILVTVTATGGSVTNCIGVYNPGCIYGGTSTGGSASGAHGIQNWRACFNVSATGATSGAFGIDNYGYAELDDRNLSGYAVQRRAYSRTHLFGGTSQTAITGTGGWLGFIPTPAQVQSGVTVLEETGTYDPVTGNYTDPGVANVREGEEYKFAGDTKTGTFAGGGGPLVGDGGLIQ